MYIVLKYRYDLQTYTLNRYNTIQHRKLGLLILNDISYPDKFNHTKGVFIRRWCITRQRRGRNHVERDSLHPGFIDPRQLLTIKSQETSV